MKTKTMYLPHELIIEILLRLPVKSLILFKCVCKLWYSLISDTHFAKSHFELTHVHNQRFLVIPTNLVIRSLDLEATFCGDGGSASSLRNLNFSLPKSISNIQIRGSCRGFIFLYCSSTLYIWNPSTGFHRQLPLSSIDSDLDANDFYGFGYDQEKDDYLVVSISYYNRISYSVDSVSRIEIFSLRANMWKEIEGTTHLPYCSNLIDSGYPMVESLFNGAIHWLAFRHDTNSHVIVGFHFAERKLLEIPLPDDIVYDSGHLWVFRGFLSLWVLRNNTVDIWVMKEYKVHSSWIKTLVLPIDGISYFSPLCCTESGDIVGANVDNALAKYNDKGEFLKHNFYCKFACTHRLAMYTESLLSLPNNSEQA